MLKGISTFCSFFKGFFRELGHLLLAFLIMSVITCLFVLIVYGTIVIQRFI
jgi:hypothetical protein